MCVVLLCLLVFSPLVGYIIWAIFHAIGIDEENKIVEEEKAKLEKRQSEIDTELEKYNKEWLILLDELQPINIAMAIKLVNHKDLDEESFNKRDELKNKIKIVEEKREKLLNEYNEVSQYLSSLSIDGYSAYKRKHNL